MKKESSKERNKRHQREFRQRMREQGYVRVVEWATPQQAEAIRAFLREGKSLPGNNLPSKSTEETGDLNKAWYSLKEAAGPIGRSPRTLERWIMQGKFGEEECRYIYARETQRSRYEIKAEAIERLKNPG